MRLKNTTESFGWLSIFLHWLLALVLIAMYFLGDYMVDLDYYSQWYKVAPDTHKSVGVIIGLLMLIRLLWNALQAKPRHLNTETPRKNKLASMTHYVLYAMVFVMVISGYLISTAKGQGIDVFELFNIPALLSDSADRGELAGDVHEWLGLAFIVLVAVHALAACLHHFVYKDQTLKRMLGISKNK